MNRSNFRVGLFHYAGNRPENRSRKVVRAQNKIAGERREQASMLSVKSGGAFCHQYITAVIEFGGRTITKMRNIPDRCEYYVPAPFCIAPAPISFFAVEKEGLI